MSKYMIYKDEDLCKKCGGQCCKNCGCSFYVSDFDELTEETINQLLNSGQVSIAAQVNMYDDFYFSTLYLRARNINRGEIDLLSFPESCASLHEDGCHFDCYKTRPSSGLTLVPRLENGKFNCYRLVDEEREFDNWYKYQELLAKVVLSRTGKTVNEIIKEDAYRMLYDYYVNNYQINRDFLLSTKQRLEKMQVAFKNEYDEVMKLSLKKGS